jgi:hypothetical protein
MAENPIGEGIANGSVIVVWFAVGQGDRLYKDCIKVYIFFPQ